MKIFATLAAGALLLVAQVMAYDAPQELIIGNMDDPWLFQTWQQLKLDLSLASLSLLLHCFGACFWSHT